VVLHAYNLPFPPQQTGFATFVEVFFSQGITRVGVPMFFALSGFLFFNSESSTFSAFISIWTNKLKRRFFSLLIPYVFWSVFWLLVYWGFQQWSGLQPYFGKPLISDYNFKMILDRIFINPFPSQLWFVRNLMVMMVFAPLFYLLNDKFSVLAAGFVIFLFFWRDWIIGGFGTSIFWFSLGAFLALNPRWHVYLGQLKRYWWLFSGGWIALCAGRYFILFQDTFSDYLQSLWYNTSIICGLVGIWFGYDVVYKECWSTEILTFTKVTFFVYVTHYNIIFFITKILNRTVLGRTPLIIYFTSIIMTIFICIISGMLFKRIMPRCYSFACGGRD